MWQRIPGEEVKKQMGICLNPSAAGFADILKGDFSLYQSGYGDFQKVDLL